MHLVKIVSGGQTGVDRGALDAAAEAGVSTGGFCPRGRLAEDGEIPPRYQLTELPTVHYAKRTAANVQAADATLILTRSRAISSAGTRLTRRLVLDSNKPLLVAALSGTKQGSVKSVADWIETHGIRVLNVAGPRESQSVGIYEETKRFVGQVIADLRQRKSRRRANHQTKKPPRPESSRR